VLFLDLVESTKRASEVGDSEWRNLLETYYSVVRKAIARYRGREIDTSGDGFFITFDGPARAIACAMEIIQAVRQAGLEVRAGLHAGECEVIGEKVGGIAVNIGARIVGQAAAGEAIVSSTVRDLVAGSGIQFEDRGVHSLKGIADAWRLYAAVR
jgi:class 3 adenylate cyclase